MVQDDKRTLYEKNIQDRTKTRYLLGYFARLKQYWQHERARKLARKNGATIGENTILPYALAKRANKNLVVGHNSSIQTDKIDLRSPVTVGNYVIIGYETEIITTSHSIDSPDWEHKNYGINIEDYAWIPSKILILPSCCNIGRGGVVGSGSVVVKDVEPMAVVSGNPAKEFKKRVCVHSDLVVESLLGGGLKTYINV